MSQSDPHIRSKRPRPEPARDLDRFAPTLRFVAVCLALFGAVAAVALTPEPPSVASPDLATVGPARSTLPAEPDETAGEDGLAAASGLADKGTSPDGVERTVDSQSTGAVTWTDVVEGSDESTDAADVPESQLAAAIGDDDAEEERAPAATATATTTTAPASTVPPTTETPSTAPPTTETPPTTEASATLDEQTADQDPGSHHRWQRMHEAFEVAVPAPWRAAAPASLHMILGSTSWSTTDGNIYVGRAQLDTWRHALYVLAHEWGHQAAYRFGTGAYLGAPPAEFPGDGSADQAELWSECVAQALVGYRWPNPYPHCPPESLEWTRSWIAAGPPG